VRAAVAGGALQYAGRERAAVQIGCTPGTIGIQPMPSFYYRIHLASQTPPFAGRKLGDCTHADSGGQDALPPSSYSLKDVSCLLSSSSSRAAAAWLLTDTQIDGPAQRRSQGVWDVFWLWFLTAVLLVWEQSGAAKSQASQVHQKKHLTHFWSTQP